jgi:hypothetical protein
MVVLMRSGPGDELKKVEKGFMRIQSGLINEGDKLNRQALEWVDENCNCPEDDDAKKKQEREHKKHVRSQADANLELSLKQDDDHSIYYQDGTGPTVKIAPIPFTQLTGKTPAQVTEGYVVA